LKLDCLY